VLQKDISPDWELGSRAARQIIETWVQEGDKASFWNVNFPSSPDLSPAQRCELDPSPHLCEFEKSPDGFRYHHNNYLMRPRIKGHDVELCFEGSTTLTELKLF
jgi:broad specificity polyphosphatase/5'/3'-nucleotidase SurE